MFRPSFLSGLLALISAPAAFAQLAPTPLVDHSDTWRYRKGTSAPAADWASVADAALDASWSAGPGGFGYGDGDDATVLSDMLGGYITLYTRATFGVTAAMNPTRHLRLTVDYDDGCIVYLGGVEVYRTPNVPGAAGTPYPYNQDTITTNHEASGGAGGSPPVVVDLGPVSGLGVGSHVLAVQGINGEIGSSDFSLIVDLDLVDGPAPPADVTWTLADSPVTLTSNRIVDGGATLTIEAGVEVILSAGVSLQAINGSHIEIAGTAAAPVVLRRAAAAEWNELSATGTGGTLRIRHADISGGTVRFMTGVTGLMEDTKVHDSTASKIVYSLDAVSATLRRCHVFNYAETNFVTTLTVIEGCLFEAPTADAVDFDGAPPGSAIRQSTFRNGPSGTNTDAVDIGPSPINGAPCRDVVIEGCMMHNFSDKGVSVGDAPNDAVNLTVRNCLIFNVARGVQVKADSVAHVEDCTIVNAQIGLHGFEKAAGTGGGIINGCFNNILSGNVTPIGTETDTVIEIQYSDIQGVTNWPGTGNLNTDPLFRDPANRDYRLLPGSPCLGTGKFGDAMGVAFPVGGLPDVPVNLQVVSFDGSTAILSWTDPDNRESGFVLERSSDGTTWADAGNFPANDNVVTVSGLGSSPSWSFRVRGANFIGAGFRSEPALTSTVPVDTDHDGMPDSYENQVPGLNANNPADAGLDLDSDGASNLDEFLAGTTPTDPVSIFGIDSLTRLPSGGAEIRFEALANKAYTVLVSGTLAPGSWQKLAEVAAEPTLRPAVVVMDPLSLGGGFRGYRIVTPPLP